TRTAIFAVVIVAVGSFLFGCSSSESGTTSSPDQATVVTGTSMEQGSVTSTMSKSSAIAENRTTADSVVITRARIVIRTLKMHLISDADDTTEHQEHDGDKDVIKAGPFVAEFNSSGGKIISTVTIPPGTY